jgi:hypothetical protein
VRKGPLPALRFAATSLSGKKATAMTFTPKPQGRCARRALYRHTTQPALFGEHLFKVLPVELGPNPRNPVTCWTLIRLLVG